MLEFIIGVLFGIAAVLFVAYIYIIDPWAPTNQQQPFIDQFRPVQIPEELRAFLKSGEDGQGISKWESCNSIGLLLHMLFQEQKDSRALRRWIHKRLQMEMNDITTRSAAGRLIQEIRIRELSLGTKFATINSIRVENVEMSEHDKNTFEKIVFVLDIDYTGGFETSIDVATIIAKKASLSVKITKLTGMIRVILSRQPYNHWTFSFVTQPVFETEINSQIQGHQLKRLIPIIKEGIRRSLQRKHVWPNYKIRYRPFFPNPIFQASPPTNCFSHVKLEGGMEVTVLQCSRLKSALLVDSKNRSYEVYCTVAMDYRPLLKNDEQRHCVSVLLTFSRYDVSTPIGLTFDKTTSSATTRPVRVSSVEDNSLADKAAFKPGDVLVAVNNVPIRSERQASRFLQQTTGDLLVLVERSLDDIDDEELKENEIIVNTVRDADEGFAVLGTIEKKNRNDSEQAAVDEADTSDRRTDKEPSVASTSESLRRRHSVSNVASSFVEDNTNTTDSLASSLLSLDATRFEKPATASVQRTESARVPQVLVSQPSCDLRRTQSESQLDAKTIEAVMSMSSTHVPVYGDQIDDVGDGIEEEMKCILVGNQDRSAPARNELLIENVALSRDRDKTLTQADVQRGMTMLHSTGSIASLTSVASTRTDTGTEGDAGDDDESGGLMSRDRPASTRKQKFHATLAAGKKKVLDLIPQKKKSSATESPTDLDGAIEVGADAGLYETERESHSRSPVPHLNGKKSPVELTVVDKKEKKKLKKKLSNESSPRMRRAHNTTNDSPTNASATMAKSRTTKSVQFQTDVMWGQSLHFELDSASRNQLKYLNVTVHARQVRSTPPATPGARVPQTPSTPESANSVDSGASTSPTQPTSSPPEPARPILLGSVSLFIPQIIDDCCMTLSNCHREVFQMKQPASAATGAEPSLSEFSRHAGFDPRLCFGDITLGFRYFPGGLPTGTALNSGEDSEDELVRISQQETSASSDGRPFSPPLLSPSNHNWKMWYGKSSAACAMCRGKIWLRNASCCGRCLVICHNKCVQKANQGGIACSPHQLNANDTQFEEISPNEVNEAVHDSPSTHVMPSEHEEEAKAILMQSPETFASPDIPDTLSKRTRLRNKVSEKFSNWRKGGKRKDDEKAGAIGGDSVDRLSHQSIGSSSTTSGWSNDSTSTRGTDTAGESPMASIQEVLSDVLPTLDGSPFIHGLYFQPGNAYNEDTIRNAKVLGREIFSELPVEERKNRINAQIDRIQTAIRETKDDRLCVMQQTGGESSMKFQGLDERLQALAVLMLHYCSALQDCQSGRSTPAPTPQSTDVDDSASNIDVDRESVADEDTVIADAPNVIANVIGTVFEEEEAVTPRQTN